MENKEYIKKIAHLPYGEVLVQIFELTGHQINRAICYNEHTKKAYLIHELADFPYLKSQADNQSSEKEFKQLENYL
ncbi:hypothetical protein EHQ91_03130 [Leptospira biflexa]|jgi:hypothetical protein|uniref:hypothetical protein n=1 Tax=Leptospira biflexa TaxID=172 RepID=UPI00109131F6|nr:hypothetical protein [Leptospira biflexa]TGM54008.1 hypothetical protein EHQ91_03130 [Leptospira biflexa]